MAAKASIKRKSSKDEAPASAPPANPSLKRKSKDEVPATAPPTKIADTRKSSKDEPASKRKSSKEEPSLKRKSSKEESPEVSLPAAPPAKKARVAKPALPPAGKSTATKSKVTKAAAAKSTVTKAAAAKSTVTKSSAAPTKIAKATKAKVIINQAPTRRLDVYVFGEGSNGELGLGATGHVIGVKRPRLNPFLSAEKVGVVQMAVGGMHCVALTRDNQILTWGVNDQGALGRDTTWEGKMVDADASDDGASDSTSDTGLNPRESTPTPIDATCFPPETIFTHVAAGDSMTFAVTDEGTVYGWGTFRSNDGILGFTQDSHIQRTPLLLPELKRITTIATGDNHALALDDKGSIFAWGCGQQNQLGRRVIERTRTNGLVPREVGVRRTKFRSVACGAYHSFAVAKNGKVWSWGLNNYGETGIAAGAGGEDAVISTPTQVSQLNAYAIAQIDGGGHHSVAVTEDGRCLVWGRIDGMQAGVKLDELPVEDVVFDERKKPRILTKPTHVPGFKATMATASTASCLAVTADGQAYSWGFSENYQTGQGTDEDVEVATLVNNTAVRGKMLTWAGAGGQFSVLAGLAGVDTTC